MHMTSTPVFGDAGLLKIGDAVATARQIGPRSFEPATFLGYVEAAPQITRTGFYTVITDVGPFEFSTTRTLTIWAA